MWHATYRCDVCEPAVGSVTKTIERHPATAIDQKPDCRYCGCQMRLSGWVKATGNEMVHKASPRKRKRFNSVQPESFPGF